MVPNRRRGLSLAVLAVMSVSAAAAAGETPAGRYTVGDLVVRLVREIGETDQGSEAGRGYLAAAGIEVRGDLDRPLDEAETVAVFNQLGANVTTSNPAATVDAATIDRLLSITLADGLPRVQAEGCHSAGCDPGAGIKQFCKNHPNLCKAIASHFGL